MYRELGNLIGSIVRQRTVWKDGDLWTSIVVSVAALAIFRRRPDIIVGMRAHFGELLTVVSIVFGFVLTTVGLYVGAIANWSADPNSAWRKDHRVRSVSEKLVEWNVWTIVWLLVVIVYVIAIWAIDDHGALDTSWPRVGAYAGLVFCVVYVGGQVLNHALTLHWFHKRIERFSGENSEESSRDE